MMAKTVTIPKHMNPYRVWVNGVLYEYPAGATVEVPDEVAEIIEQTRREPNIPPSTGGGDDDCCSDGGGGSSGGLPPIDETLVVRDGRLGVNTTDKVEAGNMLPISSSAVHQVVGNIAVLLSTI